MSTTTTTRGGLGPQGFRGLQGPVGPTGSQGLKGESGIGVTSYWQLNSNILSPINNYSVNIPNIIGLENVDNTSDANKPISTATQAALDLKADNTYINDQINTLIYGAPLILDTLKEIGDAIGNETTFATTFQNYIDLKVPINNPTFTGTVSGITSEMVKPNNIIINITTGDYTIDPTNLKDGCTLINTANTPSTINLFYRTTNITTINSSQLFVVIQKNTINNTEYITLLRSNKKYLFNI
jgi:hypothetical protein